MLKFEKQKSTQFSKQDKSEKGEVDKAILSLINKINKNKKYYTTSSCAGRIILIKDAEEKKSGLILFRSHEKINFSQLKKEIEKASKKTNQLIYFKQEPCILHVACSNIQKAQILLYKAKFAGWKRSGMIASKKRIICELQSTEKIETPIINQSKILVNDNYLKILVREANKKLERTRRKIKKLEKLIR